MAICCLLLLSLTLAYGQRPRDILNDYFNAISDGNFEKWSLIKTVYETDRNYYNHKSYQSQDTSFDLHNFSYGKTYLKLPDSNKVVLYNDSLFHDLSGSFYFLKSRTIVKMRYMEPIEGPANQKPTFSIFPLSIKKYITESKSITFKGIKEIPRTHTSCYEIEIKTSKSTHIFFFNTQSKLLDAIYYPNIDSYSLIQDYKRFNDYLFPTYITTMKSGVIYAWTRYQSFTINMPFDEHTFDPNYEKPNVSYSSQILNAHETTLPDFIKTHFTGKRVFVDLWATWCGPCKWEFKSYDSAYYAMMEKEDISLLYLSIDEDKKKWEVDVLKLGLKGYHARANEALTLSLQQTIFDGGTITIPRYLLIDKDGTLISTKFERPSSPAFKEQLRKILHKE